MKPNTPLTPSIMDQLGFHYNDLNGDSGYWQKLPFEILEGDDGNFLYKWEIEVNTVGELNELYLKETGKNLL